MNVPAKVTIVIESKDEKRTYELEMVDSLEIVNEFYEPTLIDDGLIRQGDPRLFQVGMRPLPDNRTGEWIKVTTEKLDGKKWPDAVCPTCGAFGTEPCVRGRKPSAIWYKQEEMPAPHDSRVTAEKRKREKEEA